MRVKVKLKELICRKEGDKGAAEPYLWTIFFKIDGEIIESVIVQGRGELHGEALFYFGPGSHGNLLTESVAKGDVVPIPQNLGEWITTLSPISISIGATLFQRPGMIGVIAILMEEDNTINDAIEAGHEALNNFIKESINTFISEIDYLNLYSMYFTRNSWSPEKSILDPNDFYDDTVDEHNNAIKFVGAELNAMVDILVKHIEEKAQGVVQDAIIKYYSEDLLLGPINGPLMALFEDSDDKIGLKIWRYDQDEIQAHNNLIVLNGEPIKEELSSDEWEINGEISADRWLEPFLTISMESSGQII